MSMNLYRLDKISKLPAGEDYKVPCGMNSILNTWRHCPNILSVTKQYPPTEGYVNVLSKYDNTLNDYKVIFIISAKPSIS